LELFYLVFVNFELCKSTDCFDYGEKIDLFLKFFCRRKCFSFPKRTKLVGEKILSTKDNTTSYAQTKLQICSKHHVY